MPTSGRQSAPGISPPSQHSRVVQEEWVSHHAAGSLVADPLCGREGEPPDGGSHSAALVLFAPHDERCAFASGAGTSWTSGPDDDAAICSPESSRND